MASAAGVGIAVGVVAGAAAGVGIAVGAVGVEDGARNRAGWGGGLGLGLGRPRRLEVEDGAAAGADIVISQSTHVGVGGFGGGWGCLVKTPQTQGDCEIEIAGLAPRGDSRCQGKPSPCLLLLVTIPRPAWAQPAGSVGGSSSFPSATQPVVARMADTQAVRKRLRLSAEYDGITRLACPSRWPCSTTASRASAKVVLICPPMPRSSSTATGLHPPFRPGRPGFPGSLDPLEDRHGRSLGQILWSVTSAHRRP